MGKEPTNSPDSRENYRRLNKKTYSYIAIGLLILFLIILFIPNMKIWDTCIITYSLLFWIIIIPASICRLHDIGKSGLYILLGLIPICIFVMIIYLCFKEGTIDNNEYAKMKKPTKETFSSKYDINKHKELYEKPKNTTNRNEPLNNNTNFSYTYYEFSTSDDNENIPPKPPVNDNTPPRPPVNDKASYSQSASKIDINRAPQGDISRLYGIGPILAKKIIKHRNEIGYYYNIDEFATDLNLNKHIVDSLKDKITFSKPTVNDNKDYDGRIIDY